MIGWSHMLRIEHKKLTCVGEVSYKIRLFSGQWDSIDPKKDVLNFMVAQHFHVTHGHQRRTRIFCLHCSAVGRLWSNLGIATSPRVVSQTTKRWNCWLIWRRSEIRTADCNQLIDSIELECTKKWSIRLNSSLKCRMFTNHRIYIRRLI